MQLQEKGTKVDANGNTVESWFDHDPEHCRYVWDQEPGWLQFDTSQDAWYFGVWVNKKTRQIRVFAEGDLTLTTCPTVEAFNKEIARMCEPPWPDGNGYAPGFIAKTIDADGTMTVHEQDRKEFYIEEEAGWLKTVYCRVHSVVEKLADTIFSRAVLVFTRRAVSVATAAVPRVLRAYTAGRRLLMGGTNE